LSFSELTATLKGNLSLVQKSDLLSIYQRELSGLIDAELEAGAIAARIETAVYEIYAVTTEEILLIEEALRIQR
jgi:hypothetical protein